VPDLETGRHAAFIWAAYGAAALIFAGLVLRAIIDHRIQRRALARLEARAKDPSVSEGEAHGR
jgi:heme exporter protein D